MDSARGQAPMESAGDLSALAWVQDELRRSLDAAHKALRRFVRESDSVIDSDVDTVDPAILRTARNQIHQGVGALELVGMPEAATLLRASEAAVARYIGKPYKLTGLAVEDIERASFGLLDYIGRLLAGKSVSALSLFPQYRAVQEIAGAERIHPADLWHVDWRWHALPADARVTAIPPDDDTTAALEGQVLRIMRGTGDARANAAGMSDLCAGLGVAAADPEQATLWRLAAAMFEAQGLGLLGFDVFTKRVASRLLAHYRAAARNEGGVPVRLVQDILFFCAQSESPGDGRKAPRLAPVRAAYDLAQHHPVDYAASVLGRFDPAWVQQARKRVNAAKETWSAVAGGELQRASALPEHFALVGESLRRLFPHGEVFAAELQKSALHAHQTGEAPSPALAMEVATSLLSIEAALEDAEFDHPKLAERVHGLAARLVAARQGRPPAALEPWMEELYRRVSDRQTMGSVVQELRAALSEAETQIDQFFRNPLDRRVLIPVPNQLSAMRGVLSVLGMDHASAALLRMRDDIDGLASTMVEPERVQQAGVFDRLAGNLGALGFLIDMLSVQPALAKSLFVWDAQRGTLSPVMGRGGVRKPAAPAAIDERAEARLIEQAQQLASAAADGSVSLDKVIRGLERLAEEANAAEQSQLADAIDDVQYRLDHADDDSDVVSVRGELSERLVGFVNSRTEPVALDEPAKSAPPPAAIEPAIKVSDLALDEEMREIFLEEAREVVADAKEARAQLLANPGDVAQLTTVRRSFHTLKGSSRMVGLKDFGEAAWVCEQIYNTQLADQRAAEPALLQFTAWVLDYLQGWVEQIAAGGVVHSHAAVKAAAERLAGGEAPSHPSAPAAMAVDRSPAAAPSQTLPPDLPTATELDLRLPEVPSAEPVAAPAAADLGAPDFAPVSLDFELDLGALDAAAAPAPPAAFVDVGAPSLQVPFGPSVAAPREALPDEAHAFEPAVADFAWPRPEETAAAEPPTPELAGPVAVDEPGEPAAPVAEPEPEPEPGPIPAPADDDVRVIGGLRVSIPLFNIYLNEADELSRRLTTECAEWAMELHRPVGERAVALAHSLAGSSATVGFAELSTLARALEHALSLAQRIGHGEPDDARLFVDVADEIRRLLHQFAAGFLKPASPALLAALSEHDRRAARVLEALSQASVPAALDELAVEAEAGPVPEPEPEPEPEAELVVEPHADAPPTTSGDWRRSDFQHSTSTTGDVVSQFGLTDLRPLEAAHEKVSTARPVLGTDDDVDDDIDAVDAVDAELFPIFDEEANELLPQLAAAVREWARAPMELTSATACMRTLHTLKGGARLAGAMRLGEMAHRLESRIEQLVARDSPSAADVESLQARTDALRAAFEALRLRDARAYAEASRAAESAASGPPAAVAAPEATVRVDEAAAQVPAAPAVGQVADTAPVSAGVGEVPPEAPPEAAAVPAVPEPAVATGFDWSRFAGKAAPERRAGDRAPAVPSGLVRVRVNLLDRLVNHAGEVSIARSRIESNVGQIRGTLGDLTDNLERLRQQLRDIELQAETQMSSRIEAAKAASQAFDPLEFDRFTRFQELTRMMAESVNDVATVHRTLQRAIDGAEDDLAAQARLTRELQDDLLRTRMVEFDGLADRLYRVVRLAAKETGKQVRLDILGGNIEVDRGVLDRMTPGFEHLLRNCVAHGIESPEARTAAGKDPTGSILVTVSHEGNEVGVEVRDDGRGLDMPQIRAKAEATGLAAPGVSDAELANLIFLPGFTTAESVTGLAGRGIGMDVVRSEVNAIGGRIETATAPGQGTAFKLILPLTTAVTQVVMLRVGEIRLAVPSTLVEIVRRASAAELDAAYAAGVYPFADRNLPFFWLGALLQTSARSNEAPGRTRPVLVIRSAQQRIAVHVDEVLGNQEVVVKNLGPQLSALPGLVGMTLLASGAAALIYNPVALATLYGESARTAMTAAAEASALQPAGPVAVPQPEVQPPLVLVVDDSLTVRRVTQRLLAREGYRVALAKDGLEALERLADERPAVVLSDIEMPRMDGFDLVRNIRSDVRLRDLPVIMITSRIAQKHRDYASELGVDHYLGKPYSEEDLLALVGRYAAEHVSI